MSTNTTTGPDSASTTKKNSGKSHPETPETDEEATVAGPGTVSDDEPIAKPDKFDLGRFKSKRGPGAANIETLLTPLPHYNIAGAKDFVRLHPDGAYWSDELCFASVPVAGTKKAILHLIDEDIALRHLPSARITRMRLALGTKPHDVHFLCHIPTQNLDNSWNLSSLAACEQAKMCWTQATSRKAEGVEAYKIDTARDPKAFPAPRWLKATLSEIIMITFAGFAIDDDDHPGLRRLVGAAQDIS
jgi:hypothetical protein